MTLRQYADNLEEKSVVKETAPSGIACGSSVCEECGAKHRGNPKNYPHPMQPTPCPGEMLFELPHERHPEHPDLQRAHCASCGWKGWV